MQEIIASKLSLQRTYYLYDLTNTHFEGICEQNPKAQRGKSKQKRNDCPLVAAGVCCDEHGFILFHRTFAGNTGDATTLPEMIQTMQKTLTGQHLSAPPIVVLDALRASLS
ncbi:MAG: transposase [Rhodothermales bacterium]|jgi:transposase